MRSSLGFCFIGIFLFLFSCNSAERIEMDMSKCGIGMFANILPVIFPVSENPFDLTVLPQSLNAGQSTSIKLTLKTRKENNETYQFAWADTAGSQTVSPTSLLTPTGIRPTSS